MFQNKISQAKQTFGSDNWAVPSVDALMKSDLAKFVQFAVSNCGFVGSVDSLVGNWIYPLMLAANNSG